MRAAILILLLLFIPLMFGRKQKKMSAETIKNILLKAGFPKDTVNLFVAQVLHETGGKIGSVLEAKDFNLSGIKFINKPYQKATKGRLSPEKNHYAKFASFVDWARDYKRILSLGKEKPINATTPEELVRRLHRNAYFTDNPKSYLAGVIHFYNSLT